MRPNMTEAPNSGHLEQACAGERPVDLRDRALLLTALASGGRRRSEMAPLRVEDLTDEAPPCRPIRLRLSRTKTTTSDDDEMCC